MISEQEVWDALPTRGFVRSYVEYASKTTDANIAYHLASALSILSQTVPLDYCVPYASPLWGNMYSLIVGDSSKSRKTASINVAQRILREALPGSVGEVPGSQEGLYESLRAQQRQLVVYGEFGEFLAKAEQGYLLPLKTAYTNLWDAIPIGRALANSRRGAVNDPRLSLLCGVATDLLERHTEQADWTGGFLARFLTIHAEPERNYAAPPIDDPIRRAAMVKWVKDLAAPQTIPGRCMWLDSNGEQMWADWWEGMSKTRDKANRRVSAACSRSTSIAAKTALLLAWDVGMARSGDDWYVDDQSLASALMITNLHLDSVIELGETVTGSKDMRDRRAVLRAIAEVPTPLGVIIKTSDLLKRRVSEIIESLVEERMVRKEMVGGHTCYVRTPQEHQALADMVKSQEAAMAGGGNVVPFRPAPPPPSPLVPVQHQLDEEEENWSSFEE
jgi:Protein of unknown function (DUF3987)